MSAFTGSRHVGAFDALFPFANRIRYFQAYGRRGFVEHQVLVPEAAFPSYAEALKKSSNVTTWSVVYPSSSCSLASAICCGIAATA